jgi:anti-sigma-K factor RskA
MPEDFDAILDRCLADISAGRETIDSCLRRYPAQAGRLAALLELAERMQAAPAVALPDDKRRALESRLLKRATQIRSQSIDRSNAPRRPVWRRGMALALAAVIMAALVLSSAVGTSASSVPGDLLYPLKRTAEHVRLALTPDEQQGELHVELAQQRLYELKVVQERGEVSAELLTEISSETTAALAYVPMLPQDRQHRVLLALAQFHDEQAKVLEVMVSSTQGEAHSSVLRALADSAAKQQQAKALLAGAAADATPTSSITPQPEPTVAREVKPTQGKPTMKPTAGDKPTHEPAVTPQNPTPKADRTPPGQVKQATPDKPTKEPKPTKVPKN